jgi:hypothetical protein
VTRSAPRIGEGGRGHAAQPPGERKTLKFRGGGQPSGQVPLFVKTER